MYILVLNAGSSTLKFSLYSIDQIDQTALTGCYTLINSELSHLKLNKQASVKLSIHTLPEFFQHLLTILPQYISIDAITTIGHRVVHGGTFFTEATLVSSESLSLLKSISPLAPLHNPPAIALIESAMEQFSQATQWMVFDTAFHQTLPEAAFTYALPDKLDRNYYRRFGFHGTSHEYVMRQSAERLQKRIQKINAVSLHLGNGASACAIRAGQSYQTSMGMTPTEGLVMGTRCGDLDPGLILHWQQSEQASSQEIALELNKKSGLYGICGLHNMEAIEQACEQHDTSALLARDVFIMQVRKYLGAYLLSTAPTDVIIFTGGIGENSQMIRSLILKNLESMGIVLNEALNQSPSSQTRFIHDQTSRISILVVPADEEKAIAQVILDQ